MRLNRPLPKAPDIEAHKQIHNRRHLSLLEIAWFALGCAYLSKIFQLPPAHYESLSASTFSGF
jgi:hypothetical protein